MGETTAIEWADATINPWWGCTKVSPACTNCYAAAFAARWGHTWGPGAPRPLKRAWRSTAKKLQRQAEREGRRLRVFALSMGDWLDAEAPPGALAELLEVIASTPDLDWLLLTKRPERWAKALGEAAAFDDPSGDRDPPPGACLAADWLAGAAPPNVWLGVTVEDQRRADERIPVLLAIPARVRFLSCEPLLEQVDLGLSTATCDCCERWPSRWVQLGRPIGPDLPGLGLTGPDHVADTGTYRAESNRHGALSVRTPGGLLGIKPAEFRCLPRIDWVICGGESGRGARPMHPDWARSLRDQCAVAGVPFFFKQWGAWRPRYAPCAQHGMADVPQGAVVKLWPDGSDASRLENEQPGECYFMERVGKKHAGRLLDGLTWDELPVVSGRTRILRPVTLEEEISCDDCALVLPLSSLLVCEDREGFERWLCAECAAENENDHPTKEEGPDGDV